VQENTERIAGTAIILNKEIVSKLNGNHLLDQIKVFKEAGAPNLQATIPKYANDKRHALVNVVELYKKGEWVTGYLEGSSVSGEVGGGGVKWRWGVSLDGQKEPLRLTIRARQGV
jgi:hypothetical protein